MFEALRTRLAARIAPVSTAETPAESAASLPSVAKPTPDAPLGLRALDRERQTNLEHLLGELQALDPVSRSRLIAAAADRAVGPRQIRTLHEAEVAGWHRDHPNE